MRISDWSSDVCSSDLGGDSPDWRQSQAIHFSPMRACCTSMMPASSSCLEPLPAYHRTRASRTGWGSGILPEPRPLVRRGISHMRCRPRRSEEHTSELQSLMRISYAVFCLKQNKQPHFTTTPTLTSHTYLPQPN